MAHRHFHSAITFQLKTDHVLVILFGGVREWLWGKPPHQQPALAATVILEGGMCKQIHVLKFPKT